MAQRRLEVSGVVKDIDRLSALHNAILYSILSLLPTKEVVQTCVLSKRWRDVWCSVPCLDFDETDFCKFIDSVLQFRDGSNVTNFCLTWNVMDDFSPACLWMIMLARHNVEIVDISCNNRSHQVIKFPPNFFGL
ncbi:hypothetical protein GIB67_033131 [Kingdonia uniflora]|uniref:F-box domain-containing protein n=1 Tax=Kingdonia uniflora TaxID=39325 RepID=A0A7J7MNW9_9MAGN|nr:hypothetical protein GIB67_033131 [Kingdonia uniflora]